MNTQPSELSPAAAGPLPAHERIAIIDILRGFALFGILLVNMALFKAPAISQASATTSTSLLDQIAAQAINIFAEGKFFTLFSFLFGLGFSIQLLRVQERGQPLPVPLPTVCSWLILFSGTAAKGGTGYCCDPNQP